MLVPDTISPVAAPVVDVRRASTTTAPDILANAFASLNKLAPGRIDFGVGTGFSARRAMGLGAMKLSDMEEYIRVVYGLLAGDIVETEIEGIGMLRNRVEQQ